MKNEKVETVERDNYILENNCRALLKKLKNIINIQKENNFSKENGSITIFVLLAMIFFVVILSGAYISSLNKQKSVLKNVEEIADNYEVEESEIEGIYAKWW